ncbi:phenylalanine racemase [Bacillus marasmi]|uniref:phenylalanine racemase n=1 Tax=Bacillus marasmi TaxID=1926279 RepID=UPI00164D37A0|nr:phenylalanine racemase [Bacillus marasmi]
MAELARDFSYEKDLAFFVVHFHMSPSEFNLLTEKEKMFIRKEHENKFIHDTTWMRNAMLNAEANANRKKGRKFMELFPKKQSKADKEYNENAVKTILEMEEKNGKGWVDMVYKANGMKKPIPKERGK